jgi:light-regulated signal transduction histidine kinase (bacteriophytochrome)
MNSRQNISSILISEQSIERILPLICVDGIVLDQDFRIIAVSQNVLDDVGFTPEELKNKSINHLAGDKDLRAILVANLSAGFFTEKRARLFTKDKTWISVSLTGFYLGLISDLNGSIILKIKNLDALDRLNRQLLLKKAELEEFIYRTSHDLRGPIATIRGLVNLIRLREDDEELEALINMMAERTDQLDRRLSQLLYLTQTEREVGTPNFVVNFKEIESEIQKIADKNALPTFVKLNFSIPSLRLHGLNEIQIKALVTNLFLHLLSLPMSRLDSEISIEISVKSDSLNIEISSAGFTLSDTLIEALSRSEFIYSEILNNPELVNYYTAQKIASGFLSQINFELISADEHQLSIMIPLKTNLKQEKEDITDLNSN